MKTVGIVAEFDPFHYGHQRLIREARKAAGADAGVVIAMSCSFTQRGGAAICPPAARAEMALRGGADLVLELPVEFSTASAETFAKGGVGILTASGVVDTLCFGSETGNQALLRRMARTLDSEVFRQALREQLGGGLPFAAARHRALETVLHEDLPSGANDLLGTEYLRFLPESMELLTVSRTDDGHGGAQSATRIRELIRTGQWEEAANLMPPYSLALLKNQWEKGACPGNLDFAQRAILYRLRTMTEEELRQIPDCGEGLEHRIRSAAAEADTLEEVCRRVKSKRYAYARIRRILLRVFLGIGALPEQPAYLGVLGANEKGLELLKEMKTKASLPVITKPAHGKQLEGEALRQYLMSRKADDLWGLCLEQIRPEGVCWKSTPIVLKDN